MTLREDIIIKRENYGSHVMQSFVNFEAVASA
jgi:hypothetical protein